MEFTTIASGSKGNCTFIRAGNTKILIDAGISAKKISKSLKALGESPKDIQGIFITHEHKDHIAGVRQLVKAYNIPVYASPKTWDSLDFKSDIEENLVREFAYEMNLGDLEIDFCKISHDAAQPVGMVLRQGNIRLGVVTDTGKITKSMVRKLQNLDGLVIEANHNVKMLLEGPYSAFLKRRVYGDFGHLSNIDTGRFIHSILKDKATKIVLAHLSDTNNKPSLALKEVRDTLQVLGIGRELDFSVASQNEPLPIIHLGK